MRLLRRYYKWRLLRLYNKLELLRSKRRKLLALDRNGESLATKQTRADMEDVVDRMMPYFESLTKNGESLLT